jgi:hypothetical protein
VRKRERRDEDRHGARRNSKPAKKRLFSYCHWQAQAAHLPSRWYHF